MATTRMKDKVCIVTGSSSGLGRAISLAYSAEGAHLVCVDIRPKAREEVPSETEITTHELINQQGGQAIFIQTDVTKSDQVENMVRVAVERFGRIDVLVNNAGICLEPLQQEPLRIHETPESTWDATMAVNVKSIFLCCKYVIPQMLSQELRPSGDRGWIVNLSSIYGINGGRVVPSYSASKGAVTNLTKSIALDYAGDRIHCNAICPGFTNTAIFVNTMDMMKSDELLTSLHPLRGIGRLSDIVGAAIFLAGEEAGWITGINLPVDGGYSAQ